MSEMKPCRLCGTTQSGVEKSNKLFDDLVKMVLQSGDEKQLVYLIRMMSGRITLEVMTSEGPNLIGYPEKGLQHAHILYSASERLRDKLIIRNSPESRCIGEALWAIGKLDEIISQDVVNLTTEAAEMLSVVRSYLKAQKQYKDMDSEF